MQLDIPHMGSKINPFVENVSPNPPSHQIDFDPKQFNLKFEAEPESDSSKALYLIINLSVGQEGEKIVKGHCLKIDEHNARLQKKKEK